MNNNLAKKYCKLICLFFLMCNEYPVIAAKAPNMDCSKTPCNPNPNGSLDCYCIGKAAGILLGKYDSPCICRNECLVRNKYLQAVNNTNFVYYNQWKSVDSNTNIQCAIGNLEIPPAAAQTPPQ